MQQSSEPGRRLKVAVFVEHDIVVRHFLHSGVFAQLAARHDTVFVFPEHHARVKSDVDSLDLGGRVLRLPVETSRQRLWQQLLLTDTLRWRRDPAFAAVRRVRRLTAGWKAALLFGVLALPGIYRAYRLLVLHQLKRTPNRRLSDLLEHEQPDVLLHPSVLDGVFINDLVQASTSRKLPLVVMMNSWDNPSTKRAVIGLPDWLLVWGPQTKAHALRFMAMPSDRVIEFGAAQFDVYRQPPRLDGPAFRALHDIDPAARILLYAGSSKDTDEFAHLRRLDDAIEGGALGRLAVVYRPHPWGDGGKGGGRIIDHPWRHVRIEATMRGYLEGVKQGRRGITLPDYRDTHDVLSNVDALVSPLSTILLEAALHGKPALCFLPDEDAAHYQMALPLLHFEEFFASDTFRTARGDASLVEAVALLLAEAAEPASAAKYREAAGFFVRDFEEPYAQRICNFVEQVAA